MNSQWCAAIRNLSTMKLYIIVAYLESSWKKERSERKKERKKEIWLELDKFKDKSKELDLRSRKTETFLIFLTLYHFESYQDWYIIKLEILYRKVWSIYIR